MTDRPILFSGAMVRAILKEIEQPGIGKTQTRRVLSIPAHLDGDDAEAKRFQGVGWGLAAPMRDNPDHRCGVFPKYAPGDRLWVRETWTASGTGIWTIADARRQIAPDQRMLFRADFPGNGGSHVEHKGVLTPLRWWPGIHMPREFSRFTLTVTDVRVQRLQEITEADAKAEGANRLVMEGYGGAFYLDEAKGTHRTGFAGLWEHINGKRDGCGWDANPWVVAVSFTPELRNIDAPSKAEAA